MLPESKVQEIQDFADLFFYRVLDRVKQTELENNEYVRPKIEYFCSLSPEERKKINNLISPVSWKIVEEIKNGTLSRHNREQRETELFQNLLTEEQRKEYLALKEREKWDQKKLAEYSPSTNTITLDERVWNDNWNVLSHELLHATRHKIFPLEVNEGYDLEQKMNGVFGEMMIQFQKGLLETLAQTPEEKLLITDEKLGIKKYVKLPAEVIELFGELERIIRKDICQDNSKYAHPETNCLYDFRLDIFEKSPEFFNCGIRNRFLEMFAVADQLHRRVLGCTEAFVIEDTDEHKQIYDYLQNEEVDKFYLEFICGIPRSNIGSVYFYYSSKIQEIYGDREFIEKYGVIPKKSPIFDPEEWEEMITELSAFPEKDPYLLANLIINEFQPEFTRSWPQLFLMPGKEVEERYITPIRKRMEELRAPL